MGAYGDRPSAEALIEDSLLALLFCRGCMLVGCNFLDGRARLTILIIERG